MLEDDLEPEPLPVRQPARPPAARIALGMAGFLMMMGSAARRPRTSSPIASR
jgi:hypothetical protein